jgi:hypothetical protein
MTNNSYLSIVSKDCGPAELLVRARRAGDIEKVFADAKVTRNTNVIICIGQFCHAMW